jgi:CheY-like chemotaxis protein
MLADRPWGRRAQPNVNRVKLGLWNFFTFPGVQVDSNTVVEMASEGAFEARAPPETILFVEDEALVRMDMAEFLRECGFRVQEAADANEALKILQAEFGIDLLFTDINLPNGMDGLKLAEWTFSNRPGVKVLVTTGVAATTGIPQTVDPLLAKPYTGRELLDRLKQALAKQSDDDCAG